MSALRHVRPRPGSPLNSQTNTRLLSSLNNDRLNKTARLPDGRTLGFADIGPQDGLPIFYFHGYPSTRLEAAALDKVADRFNVRIVAPERPGHGLSSFQPNRRFTDWPADVRALASHLGLDRFAVIGTSGGGPYALACAHSLPPSMLTSVGLVASAPPWVAGPRQMTYPRQALAYLATSWPGPLETILGWMVGGIRWFATTGWGKNMLENWLKQLDEAIKKKSNEPPKEPTLSLAERREYLVQHLLEAFAQGPKGVVLETQLLVSHDWGFQFEDIAYDKVLIWHGSKDVNAPVEMIRYMAERIPHCRLQEWDDSHYTIGARLDDIFTEVVREAKAKSS